MKSGAIAGFLPILALALGACTVEQTEEGRAPEIDPGEAPEYEVRPADVDLNWDTAQVRVPDLDITPQDPLHRDTTPAR
jgi:hypothetical protein